jgi:multiple sugar transport system permease protein
MIPWDVTMIPLYMEFNKFNWINTLKPLIVPAFFGSAYYIFLLRQFLMGIPKDFEEAAKIDGANDFQIFSKIFVPLMKAPLILIAVLNILVVWNDYLGPLIFLQDRSKYTLALGLASFKGVHNVQIIPIMAITTIMIIPPVLAFAFAQKYIVEGISGGIKQ